MNNAPLPILSVLIFLPLFGVLGISVCSSLLWTKRLALGCAGLELLASLWLLWLFHADDGGLQLIEKHDWIASLSIEYFVGVDGLSVMLLPMTALLTLLAMLASAQSAPTTPGYYALLLFLEAVTIGVLSALDMVLFFVFWQLTLPPLFFLMGLWGINPLRRHAASQYMLLMLFSSVPLLCAIILLAVNHALQSNAGLSFSFPVLLVTPLADHLQTAVFVLLVLGFAAKTPLLPLHTWLSTVMMATPAPITALLIGVNLGVYGVARYAMTLAPMAALEYNWVLGIVGALTLIYGALLALQQTNLRRLIAFIGLSQVGLVLIGIASLTQQGMQGVLLQLLNFGLITATLLLVEGFLQQRLGSTDLLRLGGLSQAMPKLTAYYFLLVLAMMGTPITSGFPAELLLMLGALQAHPSLGVCALVGAAINAAALLSFSRRAFWGVRQTEPAQVQDLCPYELTVLSLAALLIIGLGFFPNSVLALNQATVAAWLTRLLQPL